MLYVESEWESWKLYNTQWGKRGLGEFSNLATYWSLNSLREAASNLLNKIMEMARRTGLGI